MASQNAFFSFVLLLFTLLPFLFNSTFASRTYGVFHIKAICGQTQNPAFCVTSLEGFLGDNKKADLHKLGTVSILLATAQARFNKYVVKQLVQTMVDLDDPTTKTHLDKCHMGYDVTLYKLKSAYRLSHQKDHYKGMFDFVNDATKMTNECTMECVQLQNPLSSLKEDNQKMVWLNNIALVILGMLKRWL